MAILKGFPPSNTINCITRLPLIEEKKVKITEVPLYGRFKHLEESRSCEFMMLPSGMNQKDLRAVCYKGDQYTVPGNIYGFDDRIEVIWYREYYDTQQ